MDNQTLTSSEEQVRNWLELPLDILAHIFLKLGATDILIYAQSVCSVWRNLSKQPMLFRSIDLRKRWDMYEHIHMQKIAKEAVDRSCSQLVEFSKSGGGSEEILAYVADKSAGLRYLRLELCYALSLSALTNMAKKVFLLEELVICNCMDKPHVLKTIGKACPQLKSFRINCSGYTRPLKESDVDALAIAETMPQLRRLDLFVNKLTNVGLKAIFDGCLYLESLDLRQCYNVNLEGCLLKICRDRFIKVRLPNDSTDDCDFVVYTDGSDYFGGFELDVYKLK